MKYFFDTEFLEDGHTIELISIGIVAEDGSEYYAVNEDCDFGRVVRDGWHHQNTVPHLPLSVLGQDSFYWNKNDSPYWRTKEEITKGILDFIGNDTPEFWAYYCSYDWVVLCQLFGRMIDLPKDWPMYCMDIKQLAHSLGNPQLPKQGSGGHNALHDARWNKQCWEFLNDY